MGCGVCRGCHGSSSQAESGGEVLGQEYDEELVSGLATVVAEIGRIKEKHEKLRASVSECKCRIEQGTLTTTLQTMLYGSSETTIERTNTLLEYIRDDSSLAKMFLAISYRGSTWERMSEGRIVAWKMTKMRYCRSTNELPMFKYAKPVRSAIVT